MTKYRVTHQYSLGSEGTRKQSEKVIFEVDSDEAAVIKAKKMCSPLDGDSISGLFRIDQAEKVTHIPLD